MANLTLFQHLFGPDHFPKNLRVVEELKAMAQRYGKSLPRQTRGQSGAGGVVGNRLIDAGKRAARNTGSIVKSMLRR